MPELPELEVFSQNLDKRLAGKTVEGVTIWRVTPRRHNFSSEKINEALKGSTLEEVRREGKEVHFLFTDDHRLGVHLMLSGRFDITADPESVKSKRLGMKLGEGEWLVVSDPDGLATFALDPPAETVPDALSQDCDVEYLRRALQKAKRVAIKSFLASPGNLRGIGNAYSDEILWACRIAPESHCDRLPDGKIAELHRAIHTVLRDAIAQIKRIAPDALGGEIRGFLKIHDPEKTHCPNGHPIRHKTIAEKKSYFCEEQVEYR